MNKSDLIDELSKSFEGNRRAAQHALDAVVDTVTRAVAKGEDVAITGFGKFEKRIRPAGRARNPQTGASVRTKKRSYPKFTAGAAFKAVVNGERKVAAAVTTPAKKAASTAKTTAKKATAKKAPAKRAPAKKAPVKKATAKKAPAKRAPAKKAPAKKATAKKSTAKKSTARR